MTVLYADDDEEDRFLFTEAVAEVRPDVAVLLAKDGLEALAVLKDLNRPPRLIFLDINMPRMSGFECLNELRCQERYQHVPIIMYSTSSRQEDIEHARTAGADRYIMKENSFEKMKEMIAALIVNDPERE